MLTNSNKKNPFKVPENYFDNFHTEMMAKIPEAPKKNVIPLWKKVMPWSAAAAIFLGVILSVTKMTNVPDMQLANSNQATEAKATYASYTEEEDFFLFLEDELTRNYYSEVAY